MFKITRKRFFIIIIVLWALAAVPVFHSTNMLLMGVLHYACPLDAFLLSIIPGQAFLFVALDLILFIFFFLRLYLHPTHEKKMFRVYGIILASFSLAGIIFTTLSGALTYGSFTIARPFAGFHIIMYIWHTLMLALGLVSALFFVKKVKNDDIFIHKTNTKYVFKTIGISLIFYISLNRLGALFLSPIYTTIYDLPLTYPAYLALLLPSAILLVDLVYVFRFLKGSPKAGVAASAIILVLSVFFFIQIIYRAMSDQLFVQLCSPFNPLGRLATFPIDAILEALISFTLAGFTLANSIYFKRMSDFNALPYELREAKRQARYAKFNSNHQDKNKN